MPFDRVSGFQTAAPADAVDDPNVHINISDGALVELCNSRDNNVRFKIDFNIDQLTNREDPVGQLQALKLLEAVLEPAGPAHLAETSIIYSMTSSPIFTCDVLMISLELLDAVVGLLVKPLPSGSQCNKNSNSSSSALLLLECKQFAVKVLNLMDGHRNRVSKLASFGLDKVQRGILTRHLRLLEYLAAAALDGEIEFREDSALLPTAIHASKPSVKECYTTPVVKLIVDSIDRFDNDGEDIVDDCRRFTTAVKMFEWASVSREEQEVTVGTMLPRFLRYVMEADCSRVPCEKLTALVDVLIALDLTITSRVDILERVLMIACFHPTYKVQECYMNFLSSRAKACCRAQRQNEEALRWWTHRCLPTWIDLLTHKTPPTYRSNICSALKQLMDDSELMAKDVHMPLFTVMLVDGGGYDRLKAATECTCPLAQRRTELDDLCRKAGGFNNIEKLRFVPWSWKNHSGFSHPERKAVCAIFTATLYKHPKNGDVGPLPSEVAHEICSYLPIRLGKIPAFGPVGFGASNGKSSSATTSSFRFRTNVNDPKTRQQLPTKSLSAPKWQPDEEVAKANRKLFGNVHTSMEASPATVVCSNDNNDDGTDASQHGGGGGEEEKEASKPKPKPFVFRPSARSPKGFD